MAEDETPDLRDRIKESADESELIDNEQTDKAVEDIVRHESDELLNAQDTAIDVTDDEVPRRGFFSRWLHSGRAWFWTFVALLAIAGGLFSYPTTRYFMLNNCGVRSSSSLTITDELTGQPLKNAVVTIGETTNATDVDGHVKLEHLKLGPQNLKITRIGFASQRKSLILGWGSNPLGIFKLKAVGVSYVIVAKDYANEQPLWDIEATSGQASAVSDKSGKIVLVVPGDDEANINVTIHGDGYRTEQLTIAAGTAGPTAATLVPNRKAVFMAKANGRYDIYKMDIDGKDKELLLPGSGAELSNMSLIVSPAGDQAAFVSTRDNKHAPNGTLLNSLTLVRISDGSKLTLATAEQIQIIDWMGSRLVYRVSGVQELADAPKNAVLSYDYKSDSRAQLASANNLTVVISAQGQVFYGIGSDSDDETQPALYRVRPDGTNKTKLLDKEVWSGQRSAYNTLAFQTADNWYTYDLYEATIGASDGNDFANRPYLDNSDRSKSLFIDTRQAVTNLLLYDVATNKDRAVYVQSGLAQPMRWLNDTTAIVRVASGQETADYVVGVMSGKAHKIADVTNTFGFTQSR